MIKTGVTMILAVTLALSIAFPQENGKAGTPPVRDPYKGGGPYRVGGGVSLPVPIYKPEPEYSEEACKAKYQGSVTLQIVVNEKGYPTEIRVIKKLGLGLDEKAIEAVSKWRFKPGLKDGQPVAVIATIEMSFRLPSVEKSLDTADGKTSC